MCAQPIDSSVDIPQPTAAAALEYAQPPSAGVVGRLLRRASTPFVSLLIAIALLAACTSLTKQSSAKLYLVVALLAVPVALYCTAGCIASFQRVSRGLSLATRIGLTLCALLNICAALFFTLTFIAFATGWTAAHFR